MESGGQLTACNEEKIFVSLRLKPLSDQEILNNDVPDWECINSNTIVYKNVGAQASERSTYPTAYTFDRVFRADCSTREVYEQGAKDVALSVVSGINSNVFAYGQTRSGKTYTMTGVTEYAIADIYDYVEKHPERDFVLKFSAMEIHNESVRDLLSSDVPLRASYDPERGTIVDKLTEEISRDRSHMAQLLSACQAQRQIGETSVKETSSRSHQIITLTIESSSQESMGLNKVSTLSAAVNFVDLAGSEHASESLNTGTRLKEGCHINQSLLTLGTVIRKLSKEWNSHIPYRDSNLTRILQKSLGGNARTAIICTMSAARCHNEQSRTTLLFASCAKEVTTYAQVNIIMSDKALVKHLQKEVTRLESELRSSQSILKEKDSQIEKLEKEIRDLILKRDISQSQVKELLAMLAGEATSLPQVGLGHYPHLRVQASPDSESRGLDSSSIHSRSSSRDHFAKVLYPDDFFNRNSCPRIILSSSQSSENSYPCSDGEEIEKLSNGTSEEPCKEAHCHEPEDLSCVGATDSSYSYSRGLHVHLHANNGDQDAVSTSSPLVKDQGCAPSLLKVNNEGTEGAWSVGVRLEEGKESFSPFSKNKKDYSSIQYLDIASLANLPLGYDLAKDSVDVKCVKMTRCKSCKPSMTSDSSSVWSKLMESPSVRSGKESDRCKGYSSDKSEGCERKVHMFDVGSSMERSSSKECQSPPEHALDSEIEVPVENSSTAPDLNTSNSDTREEYELSTFQEVVTKAYFMQVEETTPKKGEPSKKNVKDVGLDPIETGFRGLTSWPVEFKRLQREIIELWHACNVSLAHRTYFFLLFQGDPSDAIYIEVEIRRMKLLKGKFSSGEETIVNGRHLTHRASTKALHQERRMLSDQMLKKFSKKERETLFAEWGIGLKTRMRRQQLAYRVWGKTDDIKHATDSAYLVAKLLGFIEPWQVPRNGMFGITFTPNSSVGICSFKHSLLSVL